MAIELLVDVSGRIVSTEKLGLLTSEEGIFDMLAVKNIIPKVW